MELNGPKVLVKLIFIWTVLIYNPVLVWEVVRPGVYERLIAIFLMYSC